MNKSTKIITNGRSQTVLLPEEFQFNCKEVFIRRDNKTGDVILSRKPDTWDDFFALLKNIEIPEDFMGIRKDR